MISIVIPLYNKARHIARAIQSVLDQTYSDFELVVVNDGSTDGSAEVVKTFEDPRVRLVHREHFDSWGGHAARNLGIAEARADLIAFLDADDEWMPEHLETIRRIAKNYPECGAYATAYEIIDTSHRRSVPKFKDIPKSPWEGIIPNYFRSSLGQDPVWSSGVAVWKSTFNLVGLFPIGIKCGGDREMWGRIALKFPIAFSNHMGVVYRKDANNRIGLTVAPPKGDNILDKTLKHAIVTGNYRKEIGKKDLIELLNWRALARARGYIVSGEKREAWSYMKKVILTRKSYKALLIYYILIIIPHGVFTLVNELRAWLIELDLRTPRTVLGELLRSGFGGIGEGLTLSRTSEERLHEAQTKARSSRLGYQTGDPQEVLGR